MKSDKERIHFLDFIRGIAILGMIAHHTAFDLTAFYGIEFSFLRTGAFSIIQTVFALAFIVISGISTNLSRHTKLNGLKVLCAALVVTIVTILITPEQPIYFGILHFMGIAMLITAFSKKVLTAIPRRIALPLFAALFLISKYLFRFPVGVESEYLFPLGLISNSFTSADYYPLIPWIFAFFFGTYLTEPLLKHQAPQWVYHFKGPIINILGRHALWIYLIHQPVLAGLLWLIFNVNL